MNEVRYTVQEFMEIEQIFCDVILDKKYVLFNGDSIEQINILKIVDSFQKAGFQILPVVEAEEIQ